MTTPLVKSTRDEQLEDVSAFDMRDAYRLAERRGFYGAPVEQYEDPAPNGRRLHVLRYRIGGGRK